MNLYDFTLRNVKSDNEIFPFYVEYEDITSFTKGKFGFLKKNFKICCKTAIKNNWMKSLFVSKGLHLIGSTFLAQGTYFDVRMAVK